MRVAMTPRLSQRTVGATVGDSASTVLGRYPHDGQWAERLESDLEASTRSRKGKLASGSSGVEDEDVVGWLQKRLSSQLTQFESCLSTTSRALVKIPYSSDIRGTAQALEASRLVTRGGCGRRPQRCGEVSISLPKRSKAEGLVPRS